MIVIDSDDYKASGIETMFFPGGEPHVKLPAMSGNVLLFLKIRSCNDLLIAACVLDALNRNIDVKVFAGLFYFPGARQDKVHGHDALTAAIAASCLRQSNIKYFVFDPHSPFIQKVFKYKELSLTSLDIPIRKDVVGIIAPDEGARARAFEFQTWFYPKAVLLQCAKVRDPLTGELSAYEMPPLPHAGRYIIVDDICDGGRTFNLLAEAYRKDRLGRNGLCKLELVVSHGIFSKGVANLHSSIEHITTTDSWCRWWIDDNTTILGKNPRLTVLPLLPLLKNSANDMLRGIS